MNEGRKTYKEQKKKKRGRKEKNAHHTRQLRAGVELLHHEWPYYHRCML
jgi:hypothetical protein